MRSDDVIRFPADRQPAPARSSFVQPVLRGAVDTLFRQRWLVLSLFSLVTLALVAYIFLAPREFESEAVFMVRNNRADLVVSPDTLPATAQRMLPEVSDAQIATEVQMLGSRELSEEVFEKAGLSREPRGSAAREKEFLKFRKKLVVSPVMKSNMIRVRYSAPTAERSRKVLDLLARSYLDRHLKLHGNNGSFRFFEQQATDSGQALRDAQARLADFQQRSGVASAQDQKVLIMQRSVDLRVMINQAEAELKETCRRIAAYRPKLTSLDPRLRTQVRHMPNQYSIERLNTLLVELRNKRTEMLTKFKADDRMVVQLDQQIRDTQKALDGAEGRVATEEASDVNPIRQGVETELTRMEAQTAGLRGRLAAMKAQERDYRRELSRLERLIPKELQIQREVKVAEDNYLLYARKREEARIGEQLDQQKISNVVLAEAPRLPELPAPRIGPAAIASYVLGVLLIVVAALIAGRLKHTVQTPWELEAISEVPVLGTVPVRSRGQRTMQHRGAV